MKNLKRQLQLTILSLSTLCLLTGAYGQITPSGDAYTNTADPTTNYGAKPLLDVESASQTTYIQFDLSSLPASYTSANITKATLKLYVNALTTAGSFNVDFVNGAWSEKTITANLSPALGTTIVASVPLTSANVHDYIIIDITSALVAWLNGTQANDGIALIGNTPLNANFDSKENTTMSHPPELDIVFAGGGTITGIATAGGSGLTGGGTSGTLNLALTNSCATNQVLQWNGSTWACATVGTGTVTSVGSGFGLTGGPITGSGSLSIDTTRIPQLVANNSFTGNQSVTGNVSATGTVSGGVVNATTSFNLGGLTFAFGSTFNGSAFFGFSGNPTTTGAFNTASGAYALNSNTTGGYNTASGFQALYYNTTGNSNTANGPNALISNTTGNSNTALGSSADVRPGNLTNATAIGAQAQVTASNSLVLGSINGVNGATADTLVGIGTTAPATTLHVKSSSTYEPLFVESSSGFGTWMTLNNTSSGGKTWAILSAAASNAEGAGNLGITNFSSASTIYLESNVAVSGNLSKASGSFKIDHPLAPANKYLYHSFVESPDMMNVYNGNVTTNQRGLAMVVLPDYFEALNRDFRYQLTVIGQFAQAIVAKEVSRNRFTIKTNKPGVKVSWQVTGIRHDVYADAHRIQVEEEKPPREQGHYLHPELFGASPEQAIGMLAPMPAATAGAQPAPASLLAEEKQ